MIIKPNLVLYFCMMSSNYETTSDSCRINYKPYTTTNIITNSDMYNINDLIDKIFMQKEKR